MDVIVASSDCSFHPSDALPVDKSNDLHLRRQGLEMK